MAAAASSSGAGSPCGACKFLRRKCTPDCIFAPYFNSEQGPARFAAIHKIFGASNASKLLLHVPAADRCEAVVTIAYEAQARIRDPVYGCVAHIFGLQQQVAILQAQLMQVKAQLAHNMAASRSSENHWQANTGGAFIPSYAYLQSVSPSSSIDSANNNSDGPSIQASCFREDFANQLYSKRRPSPNELGELQALALRMMRS